MMLLHKYDVNEDGKFFITDLIKLPSQPRVFYSCVVESSSLRLLGVLRVLFFSIPVSFNE